MTARQRINAWIALGSSLALITACSPDVSGPVVSTPSSSTSLALLEDGRAFEVRDVAGVTIDLPPEIRPWDTSFVALRDTIVARGGRASIGFKSPASPRVLEAAGYRAPVRSDVLRASLTALEARGVTVVDYLESIGTAHVRIDPARVDSLLSEIASDPRVDYIEPGGEGGYVLSRSARAPLAATRRAESTEWGVAMVRAPAAWPVNNGTGAKVAIIDTGHEQGHSDLPYVPTSNCSGSYGGCDDGPGNGFLGWHGTHVMGILLARQNELGVVGVAPGVNGSSVYVYGACVHSSGACDYQQVAAGINWVHNHPDSIKVINISIGQQYHVDVASAVATAWSKGIIIVAGAGLNNSASIYPAAYSNVIGVSGVKVDKSFASSSPCGGFSTSGSHVDLSAPYWAYSTIGNGTHAQDCGTSTSAPYVSGAVALLRAQYPTWTASQVVNRLQNTSQDLGAFGRDNLYGHGLVDAALAFGIRQPGAYDDYPDANITGPTQVHPQGACQWSAHTSRHGIRPYASYRWFRGSQLIGTGNPLVYIEPGYDNFYLDLEVTDADGAVGWESRYVVINTQSNQCPV